MITIRFEMVFMILCFLMAGISYGQYEYKLASNNPFASISVAGFATPALVDIDGDKDFDLFIGQLGSNEMLFYRNTGTVSKPVYTQQTGLNNPLNNYFNNSGCCAPSFVDIDGDGDMDMFSGVWVNIIRYFKNVGNAGNPSFLHVQGANNTLDQVLTEGICSFPSFVDIDGDLDMDVFVTDAVGKIQYYENTGSATNPKFIRNEAENPLSNAMLIGRTKIAFHDVNGDGLVDAVIGHDMTPPEILYFQNTGTKLIAKFTRQTGTQNPFRDITGQTSLIPVFVDLDNDSDRDLAIGTSSTVKLYDAVKATAVFSPEKETMFKIYPNPTQNKLTISGPELLYLEILNEQGKSVQRISQPGVGKDIDLSLLNKGFYLIHMVSNEGRSVEKLIVH